MYSKIVNKIKCLSKINSSSLFPLRVYYLRTPINILDKRKRQRIEAEMSFRTKLMIFIEKVSFGKIVLPTSKCYIQHNFDHTKIIGNGLTEKTTDVKKMIFFHINRKKVNFCSERCFQLKKKIK